jgi:hypothetical protein
MTTGSTDCWSTAQDIAEQAHDADPRERNYGLFSLSDRHPALGGGTGGFLWFESQSALLDFLANQYVNFNCPPAEELTAAVHKAVKAAVEEMGSSDVKGMSSELNRLLKGIVQMTWAGTFDELLSGAGNFDRKLRSRFRDEESQEPISPDEVEDFLEFLSTYGI